MYIVGTHSNRLTLRERLCTNKVFTVDQIVVVFSYLNYHQFSIKSFYGEILKIIHFYNFDYDPRFPPFYYMLGGNLGNFCTEMFA